MSLDQKTRPNEPSPEPPTKSSRLDLSITKVMGGALAAMTAAALGSRLSVAGTIVGAALASVVAAVASAIYTASLKHTQDKVRTVFSGRTGDGDVPTTVEVVDEAETPTVTSAPVRADVPRWDEPVTPPTGPVKRPVNWKSMIIGALAAFGIAAVALTGIELATGHALSGGDGTTITQVSEPKSSPAEKKKPAASASPSASASDEPSASASQSASTDPEPSASASEPTEPEPSATSTEPTPSSTPSSSATPSIAPSGAASAPSGVR